MKYYKAKIENTDIKKFISVHVKDPRSQKWQELRYSSSMVNDFEINLNELTYEAEPEGFNLFEINQEDICFFFFGNYSSFIFSEKVKQSIREEFNINDLHFLDIPNIECIDEKGDLKDYKYLKLDTYDLQQGIKARLPIFRLDDWVTKAVIRDDMKRFLEEYGLKGFKFEKVEV